MKRPSELLHKCFDEQNNLDVHPASNLMQQRTHPNTKRQPSRAGNIHLAYADAPSGVVLTFFFDGAMVAKLYWLGDISFSAKCSSKYEQVGARGELVGWRVLQ